MEVEGEKSEQFAVKSQVRQKVRNRIAANMERSFLPRSAPALPRDEAVGVDAGQAEHEDGGEDEDDVKARQADQQAVY